MRGDIAKFDQSVLDLTVELHCSPDLSPAPLHVALAAECRPSLLARMSVIARSLGVGAVVWGRQLWGEVGYKASLNYGGRDNSCGSAMSSLRHPYKVCQVGSSLRRNCFKDHLFCSGPALLRERSLWYLVSSSPWDISICSRIKTITNGMTRLETRETLLLNPSSR